MARDIRLADAIRIAGDGSVGFLNSTCGGPVDGVSATIDVADDVLGTEGAASPRRNCLYPRSE